MGIYVHGARHESLIQLVVVVITAVDCCGIRASQTLIEA